MSTIEVKVPDIGDFKDVEVIEILVKAGDEIEAEQSLITVESDKASMEIPSSIGGKIVELRVNIGDKVSEGSLLALVEEGGSGGQAEATGTSRSASAGESAQSVRTTGARSGPAEDGAPAGHAMDALEPTESATRGGDDDVLFAQSLSSTWASAAGSATSAAPGQSGASELIVPDIGDFKDVEVIEILVDAGDHVELEQSLITVESDKASMEIPASAAGEIAELRVAVGDKVSQGSVIATLKASSAGAGPAKPATAQPAGQTSPPAALQSPQGESSGRAAPASTTSRPASSSAFSEPASGPVASRQAPEAPVGSDDSMVVKPHASPSVRKFARELGVDLALVRGTGAKQRITHEDVQSWVKDAVQRLSSGAGATAAAGAGDASGAALGLIPWPKVDFAKFGPIESKPVARIRKISAANLHRNWVMIPHVTNHDEADITDLEAFRVQLNAESAKAKDPVKLTMLAFLIKACVTTLQKFPEFNASLEGENVIHKQYWHIGFAADTPNGLMVPVVRDADKKGVLQIAKETAELAAKAREGKLSPADMQGGTFSISSLGGIGGTYFTPIINAPEVAILGVCRSFMKPVWDGKGFTPRLILPLSLSWDHRVVDGAAAARFNVTLAQLLADFRRVLL